MNFLPELCLWPKTNPLHFADNPDHDPDPGYEYDGGRQPLSDFHMAVWICAQSVFCQF